MSAMSRAADTAAGEVCVSLEPSSAAAFIQATMAEIAFVSRLH
jgi:hypothetical protein